MPDEVGLLLKDSRHETVPVGIGRLDVLDIAAGEVQPGAGGQPLEVKAEARGHDRGAVVGPYPGDGYGLGKAPVEGELGRQHLVPIVEVVLAADAGELLEDGSQGQEPHRDLVWLSQGNRRADPLRNTQG